MIIDGKKNASQRLEVLRNKIQETKIKPKLVIVLVGDDPGSVKYVELKKKKGEEVGIEVEVVNKFPQKIDADGIIVQLPCPTPEIVDLIPFSKDVDGLRPGSLFLPATVKAILSVVGDVAGKDVAILGRSREVGRPLAMVMIDLGATVTVCNSKTKNLAEKTKMADILVSATGQAGLVTAEMVKDGAILVDVGWPRAEITPEAAAKSSAFTPVPGGIGPLTVVSLLENVYEAVKMRQLSMAGENNP